MSKPINVQDAVTYYETFINDTLKENLKQIDLKLQKINSDIAEFTQIKKSLALLQEEPFANGFKTQVDVGCNFFINAKVHDASKLIFDIGLNTYLEFSPKEACKYADARIEALEKATKVLRQQSAEAKAHMKLMLFGIGELQNIKTDIDS